MRRAIYRGPPRSDDEKKFFETIARVLRVHKDEVDERDKNRKARVEDRAHASPSEADVKIRVEELRGEGGQT